MGKLKSKTKTPAKKKPVSKTRAKVKPVEDDDEDLLALPPKRERKKAVPLSRIAKNKKDEEQEMERVLPRTLPAGRDDPHWRSKRNIKWIEEYCRIPEGKLVGQRVQLTSKQKKWMAKVYDSPTRTFILSMGRKGAKTAFSCFLLLLHLVGPESIPNGQLYSAAQSREQAAILFNYAAKCIRLSPDLSEAVIIRDTAKQLHCQERGTTYRALSAEASTAHGLSPCFIVHDELGQVRGNRSELYEALETASAAQEHPLSIVISTQAPSNDDLLSMLIDDALTGADPMAKIELYTAPMEADPFSEKSIRLANPHFDEFMNKTEVLRQAADAERQPSREAAYRNLVLNQRVESKQAPFVTRSVWERNNAPPMKIDKKKVWGGLDLSSVNDLTALILLSEDGDVIPTFWLPDDGLAVKARNDRVPYDVWKEKGYLETTPGPAIEYAFVASYMKKVFEKYDVQGIGFDRYNMKFLKPWLVTAGLSETEMALFSDFGQGFVSMSPAIRELETLLLGGKLKHGGHPVLAMCAANCLTVNDPAGNRKFTKAKSTGRIDGMVGLAMAAGIRISGIDGKGPEVPKEYQMFFV